LSFTADDRQKHIGFLVYPFGDKTVVTTEIDEVSFEVFQ
jgi:hypothetical protein